MDKLRRYFGVLALALFAAWTLPGATPVAATTSTIAFAVDTRSGTRTFATMAAINAMLPIYTGSSTASAKDPNTGTTSAIASTWKPTASGTWELTLASPSQSASITVPYELFQTGAGTSSSPYVFKSNEEAANYAANGVYFTFGGSLNMDSFTVPTGYAVQPIGSGKYQLVTSSNVKYISEAAATFAVDSRSGTRTFATMAAINAMLPIYTGSSTASAKNPNGTTSAIASTWKPTAGGTWELTLASPSQSASITVPFDLFQTGAGTSSSPYVFKSNAEAANYAANGVYFTFGGSLNMDSFTVPTGYAVQPIGSGKYQLVTSNAKYISEAAATFAVDSLPNPRTVKKSEILPLTYKKGATVKITSPSEQDLVTTSTSSGGAGTYNWTPADGSATYVLSHSSDSQTATFNYSIIEHTITWKQDANTVIDTTEVEDGAMPAHAEPVLANYIFTGWTPALAAATADATYTAVFVPVVATVNDTPYASFAEARTAAGTDGSKTIVMRKADSTATTLTIGQVLKVDNTAATYSGTVSASGTNVKIVTTTSGKVTTYTCKYDLSKATVAVSGTYTYTGSAITPTYTVTLNSTTLTKGTHYTEALSNNTNAGTATITLTGTSSYDGTKTQTFTIGKATVTCPANAGSKTYNGQTQTASITAPAGSSVKTNAGGKNVGAYNVVLALTSTTNYKWSDNTTADKTIKFNITAKTLTDAMVSGVNSSYTYTGSQIKPTPTVADSAAGITSSDYTVTWGTNTTVAQGGTVTVTAKGNYTGAVTKTFTIAKAEAVVTVAAKSGLVYSGEAQALVTQSGLQGGTIAYTLDGVAGTSAIPTGIVPKNYTVGWKVTGDANHSDKSGSVTVAISGTVAGEKTITLGSGVEVAIPAGVTVTVSEAQAVTAVSGGKVVVKRGGARAETNGTIAANGVITGEAVYLYGSQSEVDAIRDLENKTLSNGTLKIKADEL